MFDYLLLLKTARLENMCKKRKVKTLTDDNKYYDKVVVYLSTNYVCIRTTES